MCVRVLVPAHAPLGFGAIGLLLDLAHLMFPNHPVLAIAIGLAAFTV